MNSPAVLPLNNEQTDKLQDAVADLSPLQLQWVSGYAAGLAAGAKASSASPAGRQLTVLYGSQTGNGEAVAQQLAAHAQRSGFAAQAISLADFKPAALKRQTLAAFVISTHGEGDPPDDAELFCEYLQSARAPQLGGLRYTVLALGDSSYANFCKTGRDLDARLQALGAQRFSPVMECDLDYDTAARDWSDAVVAQLPERLDSSERVPQLHAVPAVAKFGKHRPFPAEVLVNQKITGRDSTKDVRHIELSIEDPDFRHEPGDSLAVLASNPPTLVDELLGELALSADSDVLVQDARMTLRDALMHEFEVTSLNSRFLDAWASASGNEALKAKTDNELSSLFDTHQVIDVVRAYRAEVGAQQLVDMLRKMSPRSYSIASSLEANPGEVHLTVAALRYEAFGTPHVGAASTFLADRVADGDTVQVYVETNHRFRLPAPELPIIMIGPGTGVAPFRAFMEQRVEQGASGNNWLFFGERNFSSDFLYQLEWQRHLKSGHLARLDVAFSRDQQHKVYVQDRIIENAAEVYRWIEQGAHIYVCGDEKRMAKDVHKALLDVIESEGNASRDVAEERLKDLRRSGRYQRDVY